MNLQAILGILNILLATIPQMTNSKVVSQTVAWLIQIEPTLVQFAEELGPIISNIVAAFEANPATTATQLAALKVLDAKTDKDFDDAISAYLGNHPDGSPLTGSVTVLVTGEGGAGSGSGQSPLPAAG